MLAAALIRVAQEQSVNRRDPLIRDVYEEWLAVVTAEGTLAQGTMDVCHQASRRLRPLLGRRRASEMTSALTGELLDAMLTDGLRLSTARARLAKLRASWTWALDTGLVTTPWRPPPRRGGRRNRSTPKRAYSVPELATMLTRLAPHYRLPAQVLAETGCRPGELMAADVDDLQGDWLRVDTAKAGGQDRLLPLRPGVAEALRRLAHGRRGALFLGERDGKRLAVRTLGNKIAAASGDMRRRIGPSTRGASYDLDQYSLRRALIDHAALAGVDEVVTRTLVGHSTLGVHHGYRRGSVTRRQLREAVDRVAEWRSEQLAAQTQAGAQVTCSRWASDPAFQSLSTRPALVLGESQSGSALEATTRTEVDHQHQTLALHSGRLAVYRAAVGAPGCRGLFVHLWGGPVPTTRGCPVS